MRLRALPALLVGLVASGIASAQQAPSGGRQFAPPPDDPSVGMLRDIFGNLVDYVTGTASAGDLLNNGTVIAAGFEIFNTAVLFLGMIFVAYTTIIGVLNTAHDGEFLGRKMSSIWVPLRTAAGSALLLPLAGGFSAIQIVVMWLAVQGVGIGDSVWTAMLTRIDQGGMIGHPHIPDARPLAANIFKFEICQAAMNQQFETSNRPERVSVQTKTSRIFSVIPTDQTINREGPLTVAGAGYTTAWIPVQNFYWRASGGYVNPDICGSLEWEENPQSQEGNARYLDLSGIAKTHGQAVTEIIRKLRPVAQQIVAGEKPNPGAIEQAAYAYEQQLQAAARSAVEASNQSSRDAFVDFAKTGGWIHAGAYYNHIIQLNDAVQLAVNSMPVSSSMSIIENQDTDAALIKLRDSMAVADEYLKLRSESVHQAMEVERDNDTCLKAITSFAAIKRCLSKPAVWAIEEMTQQMAGGNTSHVAQVKSVGDSIMTAGWTLMGTFVGAHVVLKEIGELEVLGTKVTGGVGGISEAMIPLVTMMVIALLGFGAVASYYMPLIPFIAWITGVIKWVVSVTEALIAAPIFAAAHIHPDGDDAIGRAGPGYMIILSMILRPVLMLFGFFAAISVAQPIAHLVNATFIFAVKGSMHDSANGIGAFIAYCAIYMIIMTTVLHAVFALINYIPDQGLRFMGNAVGIHGIGDSEDGEASRVFATGSREMREAPKAVQGKPDAPKPTVNHKDFDTSGGSGGGSD